MTGTPSFLSNLTMSKPWRFVVAAAAILMIYTFTVLYHNRTADVSQVAHHLPPAIAGSGAKVDVGSGTPHANSKAPDPVPPPPMQSPAASDSGSDSSSPSLPSSSSSPSTPSTPDDRKETKVIDWSRFAYFQYMTSEEHVCQSVMIYEALNRAGSKADRLMLFPREWQAELDDSTKESKKKELLIKARDKYKAILKPVEIQRMNTPDPTWAAGFTKLLIFNQTEYDRVLGLDSDANVLQSMDELFLMPPAPAAMPRAYWLAKDKPNFLSDQLWLVQPSEFEMKRIEAAKGSKKADDYDMEIMNQLYGDNCLIIPHRKYDLLSGEFKHAYNDHAGYLGNKEEVWDGNKILKEAKFLHFSDWPLRKPWYSNSEELFEKHQPKCVQNIKRYGKREDCTDRDIWRGLYTDYAKRRKDVCGLDLL